MATKPSPATAARHAAAAIVPGAACCAAASALAGQRFLAAQAPLLPLRECTTPATCQCRYRKFPDRRDGDEERRSPAGSIGANWYGGQDKRRTRGRRQDD